ncbi:MAG TPA: adenylate/guanylate cyclase domain-containing protein [Tepidiformaceae bacterium]|nr:adenylate/guanylate cyclase domain-containing protein [Tepidiformaceae bacterium]
MDPLIQYATTRDGLSIACASVGSGPPLLILPILPLSHLQVEWQMPGMRELLESVASHHTVIRFDARGLGLSERNPADRSLDAHLLDIDAVVEKLRLDRFAIFAASYAGPMGIRYAARHPDRVTRLLLWCTHAFHGEVVERLPEMANQQRVAVNQLAGVDRDLFIRTYLHRAVGWTEGELANQFVEVANRSIDPEAFFENLAGHAAFDAREDLPNVRVPALIMHRPAFVGSHLDVARGLAARMPDARLVVAEGESVVPFIGNTARVLSAIESFLHEDDAASAPVAAGDSALRIIFYTDIEAHSAMMHSLGDARGRDVLREHERITRARLREFGGTELQATGDGFIAAFTSAQAALGCAIALQRQFHATPPIHGHTLRVRVGLNAGEPIPEGNGLFGASVNAAERIAGAANGGEILVSQVVRELVAGKAFRFTERLVRNRATEDEAPRLYEVHWRGVVPD